MKSPGDGPYRSWELAKTVEAHRHLVSGCALVMLEIEKVEFRPGSEILVCRGSGAGMGCWVWQGLGISGESGLKHETTFAVRCSFEWGRID